MEDVFSNLPTKFPKKILTAPATDSIIPIPVITPNAIIRSLNPIDGHSELFSPPAISVIGVVSPDESLRFKTLRSLSISKNIFWRRKLCFYSYRTFFFLFYFWDKKKQNNKRISMGDTVTNDQQQIDITYSQSCAISHFTTIAMTRDWMSYTKSVQ